LLDLYLSFSGGPVLQRLAQEYGAHHAAALYCSVDASVYASTGAAPTWDLGYLGTYSPDRQPMLERLLVSTARCLPDRRFVVAGPQYPDDVAWPANVERIEHLPPTEHARFYGRQRFTLNVTRVDMVATGWSPSVRLFEAASCGTPIISDRWPGLNELLPEGEAILLASNTADVVGMLTSVDEDQRLSLARAARSIVLKNHTGEARARDLLRYLDAARSGGQSVAGSSSDRRLLRSPLTTS
jgi:spore maturation protein CgeB